jgi:hypothetical protein
LPTISLLMNVSEMKMVRYFGRTGDRSGPRVRVILRASWLKFLPPQLKWPKDGWSFVPSEIDLATHIANIDGKLVYLY